MASHLKLCAILALAGALAGSGCGGDSFALSAETDDPLYRDGQQLEKQGRNQEALADYLKVIAKRGDAAPESHLEAGLIYLEHVEDPIAAIYHFRKYLELEPNSRQAGEVRGLIDTAKLNFARTLPGRPLDNAESGGSDGGADMEQLRRENEELRAELAAYRSGGPVPGPVSVATPEAQAPAPDANSPSPPAEAPAPAALFTPVTPAASGEAQQQPQAAGPITLAPVAQDNADAPAPPAPPPPAATTPDARTHTVARGDTLYSIAQRYYGVRSRAKVLAIVEANSGLLSSPSSPLKIGMVLRIP